MAFFACAILLVVLVALGVMQYRWIAELRAAERRQLEASLKATADQFADDFAAELLRVVTAFQVEYRSPSESVSKQLADAYEQWKGSAANPTLIRDILTVKSDENETQAYRFNTKTGALERISWPEVLDPLRHIVVPTREIRVTHPTSPVFLEGIPALAVPFLVTETAAKRKNHLTSQKDIPGWSVVQLDGRLIETQLLPALFQSHFAIEDPLTYRIAVASAARPHHVIYQSEPISEEDLNAPDLVLDLLPKVGTQLKTDGPHAVRIVAPETPRWQLFVKHRLGSLDAAVESLRRRDLAIAGGILLVLSASAILFLVSANRVRKLGQLQLELAAAISHELRTPVAVIQAASYNLEEGVIENPAQVRHYAHLLRDAGRRLTKIVDQILLLAEARSFRRKINLRPVDAGDAVDRALEQITVTLPGRQLPLEKSIPSDLPKISADPLLVGQCIQNLVTNALKYGEVSNHKPLKISVEADSQKREVQIRVSDQGPGINQLDFPHICEPFYRGKQSHLDPSGNGLGLALVLRLMELQLGSLSVQTSPYTGATFILHFAIAL
jgi:signal transduction histidine kinase